MTTIHDDIASLKKEIDTKRGEADALLRLSEAFPGLSRYEGRWKKVVYCSKSVNSRVTCYEFRFNCGCCNDSPLEVWTFMEIPEGRVYSDPPMFMIGDRDYTMSKGAIPYSNWDAKLRSSGIPETVIKHIGFRFEDNEELSDDE